MDTTTSPIPPPAHGLADRLCQLAQGREALDVAQFRFVGLEEIRSAYGERWPEQKQRIQGIAEGFLRHRMDASDLLISAGGGFLVVFGSVTGAEAEAVAGHLSHSLNEFFLGDSENAPAPGFDVATHSVPAKELAMSLGDVEFVTCAAEAPESFRLTDVDWRFQPVWDVKRETLSSWYVSPYLKKTQKRLPGYQFESVAEHAVRFAAVDEMSLGVSEQAIKELLSQGKQALVGVSIHARTLTNVSARGRILSMLDNMDRELHRYRIVKIAGVAPGFPRLYLTEIVRLLKARSANVVIGAAWDEPDMAGLLQVGPLAIGVSLPGSIVGPAATKLQAVMIKLCKDVQSAHAARVRFFVEGEIPASIAMRLGAIGVDSISSPRIWPATGTPDAMLKWPAARLAA